MPAVSKAMLTISLSRWRGLVLPRLSDESRKSLALQASAYHQGLTSRAQHYLNGRGIDNATIEYFQIGVVTREWPEHEAYTGMVSIPYITTLGGVVGFKFRQDHDCPPEHSCKKYLYPEGQDSRLFNPMAFDLADQSGHLAICEGEMDAMILTRRLKLPCVGIPGTETWKNHKEWPELFRGYQSVKIFYDDDPVRDGHKFGAGLELAHAIARDISGAQIVSITDLGHDVTEAYMRNHGAEIRRRAGLGE